MRLTDLTVLRAAADGGVVIERYTNKAHASATGKPLSVAAARRAADRGHIRRHLTDSLNFHYGITDVGREALQRSGGAR